LYVWCSIVYHMSDFSRTIEWYDKNAAYYANSIKSVTPTGDIDMFLRYTIKTPYVLEAGCGPGRETKIFRDKKVNTVGVDVSEGLLQIARKENPTAEFIIADFKKLPFDDETFDGVFARASLVHCESIKDAIASLREFYRVLKNSGTVFIAVKQRQGDVTTEVVSDVIAQEGRFFRYYSLAELKDLLQQSHFEILHEEIHQDRLGRSDVAWIKIVARKVVS
jgi:ubiquinone/menaquinone biosynthesis C-methylase UbiE